jgi:hypothetical protein
MMNMMTSSIGLGSGFLFFWFLHVISVIFFFVGLVFLVAWAIKTFDKKELKQRGIWLVVIGSVLCLLTIAGIGRPWMGISTSGPFGNSFMFRMMDVDDDDDDGFGMMGGAGIFAMNGMTMMLSGKTGDSFDEAFIRMMIPHHQGAIDMAKLALKNAKHQEIKDLANAIIQSQQREIDQMQQWLQAWGYDE